MNPSRTPFVIGALIVGILVALGAFALITTGSDAPPADAPTDAASPQPSPTEGSATVAPRPGDVLNDQGTTVIRFEITGECEGCGISATPAKAQSGEQIWQATIAAGSAQLELPTPNTYGLSFAVSRKPDKGPAVPVALLAAGTEPGAVVDADRVAAANRIGYCWAGTTFDTTIVQIEVVRREQQVTLAYADPAVPIVGDQVTPTRAAGGQLGCPSVN